MARIHRATVVATLLAVASLIDPHSASAAAGAVPNTPTPPSGTPTPSPTWPCIAEWTWLSRDLPAYPLAGVPFTVDYAYRGGSATIRRTEETVPPGWQVLSPPWSEHAGDTYVWNWAPHQIEVLPPAGLPSGDYHFSGRTTSYHPCNGDVSMSIEGDQTVHLQVASTPCIGDCDAVGQVTIDNLLTMVNIALGDALPSACPYGVPSVSTIDVALIIQAVNRAMEGCDPLPWQAGPFGVGVREVTFTKESETAPTQRRVLVTDIWYPTAPDARPEDADLGGVLNAPWGTLRARLPLLLFSHGNCSLPTDVRFFMRALASYGFIVAAPLHAGDLRTDPNCGTDNRDGVANRVADIEFVIDSLLQLDTRPALFFSGAIDPQRLGISGYSYGGNTALRVSASDARVIAAFVGAAPLNSVRPAAIRLPVMVQGGELDSAVPFGLESTLYGALNPPKYLVEILLTGHTMFSDDGCWSNCCGPPAACTICEADRSMPFCDAAGPGALTADAAQQLILRYAVPFLLHWVAGDRRFDAFLAPDAAPPGVILSLDPGGSATGVSFPAR